MRPFVGEASGELGEDGQVGVQPNPVKTANAEREESPLMLEAAKLTLDSNEELERKAGL